MPIVFILLGLGIVLGFLVIWGVTVFLTRGPPEEDAQDDSESYL
jgi:hypothetical protein